MTRSQLMGLKSAQPPHRSVCINHTHLLVVRALGDGLCVEDRLRFGAPSARCVLPKCRTAIKILDFVGHPRSPLLADRKALIRSKIRQVVLIVQVFKPWRTHQEHCGIVFRGKSEAHGVRASPLQPPTKDGIAPTPQQKLVTPIFWTFVVGKLHLDDKRWVQRCPSCAVGGRYWFVEKLRVFHPLFKRVGKRRKSAGLVTALAVCMKRRPV